MAPSAIPAQSGPASRIQAVDALRGAIMMLMAIDHIRDYVARSAQQFLPTDLTRTTPAIFFTRWITHFCAPVFILTAGLGAYFWMTRGHHSKGELSRLLISSIKGEVKKKHISFGWTFSCFSAHSIERVLF
jgi:uncharacterized membrane protein